MNRRRDAGEVAAAGQKGFNSIVKDWIKNARHPKFHRLYNECVYQPMLELLVYLRANGFKTFIVSGGGVEFMRAFAEQTYGASRLSRWWVAAE